MAYYWDEAREALAFNWEETHPNIKVEPIVIPAWGDYPVKAAAMFASATLGDTLEFDAGINFNIWAHRGMLRPLDDLISATDYNIEGLFPAAVDALTHTGHIFGLPQYSHPGCVAPMYNADLFDELGVDAPANDWDYNEFVDTMKNLTQDTDGDGQIDIWGYVAHAKMKGLYPRLRANGGQVYDPTAHECIYDQPAGIQTLTDRYDLFHTHKVSPIPGAGATEQELWRSQKAAMWLMTPAHIMSQTLAMKDEFRVESVLMPKNPETGARGSCTAGISQGITTLAKEPEAVWEYLTWVSSTWFGVEAFKRGLTLPGPQREAWLSPEVTDEWPMAKEIVDILDHSEAAEIPWNLRGQEIDVTFTALTTELWVGDLTPEECADRLVQEINDILAKPML
ncbi:MAG: extracellular solute-binding protein, partial [Candidatus Hadarchaeota archaeon]|nr:extracellular solute-binding protein [Candidatus Hadarchaeota archaeon]